MRIPFGQWRFGSEISRGLYWSMIEGAVVGAMLVCLEAWMVPLLQQRLGAAVFVIGLVSLIPQIGSILLSPFSGDLVDKLGGPKRAALTTVWLQIGLLALLSVPLHAAGQAWAVPMAVILLCTLGLSGVINGPAWVAWMGALLPSQVSGRYQANRARVFHAARLIFAGVFVLVMRTLPAESGPWGLQIVVLVGVLSRLASLACLSRQPFPAPRPGPRNQTISKRSAEAAVGLLGFLRTMRQTDIGRWSLVWASFFGGCAVVGPFCACYMIANESDGGLALTPFFYTVIIYTGAVSRIVFLPLVGRMVDVYGPRAMVRLSFVVLLILPLTWILTKDIRLIIANEVVGGFAGAAAECAIGSLLFACHRDPARRAELIGYFNTVSASLAAAGLALGTILIEVVPPLSGSRYLTLFLISFVIRAPGLILALRWLPGLRPITLVERDNLWKALPGAEVVGSLGRGVMGMLRRLQV